MECGARNEREEQEPWPVASGAWRDGHLFPPLLPGSALFAGPQAAHEREHGAEHDGVRHYGPHRRLTCTSHHSSGREQPVRDRRRARVAEACKPEHKGPRDSGGRVRRRPGDSSPNRTVGTTKLRLNMGSSESS